MVPSARRVLARKHPISGQPQKDDNCGTRAANQPGELARNYEKREPGRAERDSTTSSLAPSPTATGSAVAALDRLLEKDARAGGQILGRTSDGPRGESAYFADVDGYLWRIAARA
jgi:hypothetical protein